MRAHSKVQADAARGSAQAEHLYAAFRNGRYFGSLDGLRALSVIAVIWHHTMGKAAGLPTLFSKGYEGVTLFFAISGFLIVTLLLREQDRNGRIDLRAFYIRRTLRIFPLYFAVLGMYTVLVFALERHSPAGQEFFRNLVFYLTYTSNWFVLLEGRVIFYFAWSLAAEEQFYLLWPSIQRFATRQHAMAVMLTVIVIVATLQWSGPPQGNENALWYRIVTGIPLAICLGVVLAHLLHDRRSYQALHWLLGQRASSTVFALCFLASLQGSQPQLVVHLSAALLVGACVYREDHWLAPLLKGRAIAFVGSVSYGIYLLHMLVKNALAKVLGVLGFGGDGYLVFVLTVAGSIAVAAVSYRYFESSFLRRKRQFSPS